MTVGKLVPEAFKSLFHKVATVRYPAERLPIPAGLRGAPKVDVNVCIGCKICARDCPAKAIEMVDVGAKFPRPAFHYDRCVFCGVCGDVCPKKCITITNDFEMASTDVRSLFGKPGKLTPPPTESKANGENTNVSE